MSDISEEQAAPEETASDDESDMAIYDSIAKEYQTACNIMISRQGSLQSTLNAMERPEGVPETIDDSSTMYQKASRPALMYDFVNISVWSQAISKIIDIQPTPDRNTQIECVVYKQLVDTLHSLVASSVTLEDLTSQLLKKRAERDRAVARYMEASSEMEKRLESDKKKMQRKSLPDEALNIEGFKKKNAKLLQKQLTLRMILKNFLSHGKINFVEHPEYIQLLKDIHKPITAERVLEKVRLGAREDEEE